MRIRASEKATELWGLLFDRVDATGKSVTVYEIIEVPVRIPLGEYVRKHYGVSILDDNVGIEELTIVAGKITHVRPSAKAA